MPDITNIVISTIIAALVVPLLLKKLSASDQESALNGKVHIMECTKGAKASMYVCCILFTALALLAWRFPGKTDPAALPWIIAIFIIFASTAAYSAWLMHRSIVRWNESMLSGTDSFGKHYAFSWDELTDVEYVTWAQALRFTSKKGERIWVSPMMSGIKTFMSKVEAEADRLGLKKDF